MALLLLVVPLKWSLSWVIAAAVHELFHLMAILLTGSEIKRIVIGASGAQIDVCFDSCCKEVLCAVSGPVGGLLLLLTVRKTPMIAVCALIQSLYNLLPIYPLDGGRALWGILRGLIPKCADKIYCWLRSMFLVIACVMCAVMALHFKTGILPMVFICGLILPILKRKSSCKAGRLRVQ